MTVLARAIWETEREEYLARVRPHTQERLDRMNRGEKHPVHDFLFEYYSFRPAHLLRWTPGFGVCLESATRHDVSWGEFVTHKSGLVLHATAFPSHRVHYLQWAVQYLATLLHREPSFACSGLHEWAMVYRDSNVRHPYVPLRLSAEETDRVVESQPLRCSHYDAFRFFTPAAVPRNRWELSRVETTQHDQPGCLHANMDLYRLGYKIAPFCPSAVIADAFDVACMAREVDMRASPYDLASYGYSPIRIETADGRAEYAEAQRHIYQQAQPVRERLLTVYRDLLANSSE